MTTAATQQADGGWLIAVRVRVVGRTDDSHEEEDWRQEKYIQALNEADAAFRERNYPSYLELLAPYEDLMTGSTIKKFETAKKRLDGG